MKRWLIACALVLAAAVAWWSARPRDARQLADSPLAAPPETHPGAPARPDRQPSAERHEATSAAGPASVAAPTTSPPHSPLAPAWTCLGAWFAEHEDPAVLWAATLDAQAQEDARLALADARAFADRHCRIEPPGVQAAKTSDDVLVALLELASTAAGDGWQRLAALLRADRRRDTARTAAIRGELERLLPSALAARDVAQMALIGQVAAQAQLELGGFGDREGWHWVLAACDLGADCGPRSAPVRQLCLQHALCGYPDLESALMDGVWAQGWAGHEQERRRELVARLRASGGLGLFDPLPPPAARRD